MKIFNRIRQALIISVSVMLFGFILMAIGSLYYAFVRSEYSLVFALLMIILLLCAILSSVPKELTSEPPPELTPESLETSVNRFEYRFRNRFLKSSTTSNHVVSYVVIDIDKQYIHFLNCSFFIEGMTTAYMLRLERNPEITRTLPHYKNKSGCEINQLVGVLPIDCGGYYLIYWTDHFAIVARRTAGFPKFEETLRTCGFDIKTRRFEPPEEAHAVQALGGCTISVVVFASVILAALDAPLHSPDWMVCLYVILLCGSMTSATWYLFYQWEKYVFHKRAIWRDQERMAKLKPVESTLPANEAWQTE